MNASTIRTALLCTLFGLSTAAFAEDAAKTEKPAKDAKAKKDDKKSAKPINKICPVEGGEVDPAVTVTHKGKVVAFCCAGCDETFKTNPAKYLAIIAADPKNKAEGDEKKGAAKKDGAKKGEAKGDEKADAHEHEGDDHGDTDKADAKKDDSKTGDAKKGDAKKGDAEKDDAESADAAEGEEKEAKLNAKCPVSGDDADPKLTSDYKGRTVAFCCEECAKDFEKTPTKYLASLEAQDKAAAKEDDHDHDGDGKEDHDAKDHKDDEHEHDHDEKDADKAEKAEK